MEKLSLILANLLEHAVNNYSDDLAILIGAGIVAVLGFIGSKIKNAYVAEAWDKITIAVTVTQQTIVDDLKSATADGKLTDEDKAKIKAHAKAIFFEQFGIVGKALSTLFMGSLEKWFNTQSEFIIAEMKKKLSPKSSTASTPTPSQPTDGQ